MKTISILFVTLGLALTGCSKKSDPATTTTTPDPNTSTASPEPGTTTEGEGTPCAQEVALVCPDDQIDACLKTPAEGDVHKCVAK